MTAHVVKFRALGRIAVCTCGWRASVSEDLSDWARSRRVIDAAEDHAFDHAGRVELAGLGPVA